MTCFQVSQWWKRGSVGSGGCFVGGLGVVGGRAGLHLSDCSTLLKSLQGDGCDRGSVQSYGFYAGIQHLDELVAFFFGEGDVDLKGHGDGTGQG